MKTIVDALKYSCEKKNVYPHVGVVVFRFWVVILAFIAIQLAWNLRPFLGDRGRPFELFRDYEGNFYTALIYSVRQIVTAKDKTPEDRYYYLENEATRDSLMDKYSSPEDIFED